MFLKQRFFLLAGAVYFCITGMLYGSDKQNIGYWDPYLLKTGIECVVAHGDPDFKTLRSCACASKNLHQFITQELAKRKLEIKQKTGELSYYPLRAYQADYLSVAYIENYGTDYKEKNQKKSLGEALFVYLDYHSASLKVNKYKLPKFFYKAPLQPPLFFTDDIAWTHIQYIPDMNHSGVLMGVDRNGCQKYAKFFVLIGKELVPSGWLADFLPRLHDEAIRQGSKQYFDWALIADKNSGIMVLPKRIVAQKFIETFRYNADGMEDTTGLVIVDINSMNSISRHDAAGLYVCMPQHTRNYHYIREKSDKISMFLDCYTIANMHLAWGDETTIADHIDIEPLVKYKISHYGCFYLSSVTEKIRYKYSKKISKDLHKHATVLLDEDEDQCSCDIAINFLIKKKVLAVKNWFQSDSLKKGLRELAGTRYMFKHSTDCIAIVDMLGYTARIFKLYDQIHDVRVVKPHYEMTLELNRAIDFSTFDFIACTKIHYKIKDTVED